LGSFCVECMFCWDCVVKRDRLCPSCHGILEPSMCTENLAIQKLIEKVPIPCPFDGCSTLVTSSTAKAHSAVCEYATVLCPNSELCGFIARNALSLHERELCLFREVHCHSCDANLPLTQLQIHLEQECDGVVVQCPNNCSLEGVPRAYLARHLLDHCPNTDVPCPFSNHGCDHVMKRSEMESHLVNDVSKHLLAVTSLVEVQQREIAQLKEQLSNPVPAPPLLTAADIRACVAGYVADYQPLIDNFAAAARMWLRWPTLLWLLLGLLCLMWVPRIMRLAAFVYVMYAGYQRFIVPFKRHLAIHRYKAVTFVYLGVAFIVCIGVLRC